MAGKPKVRGLQGSVTGVTGAAHGIGRGIYVRLAEEGVTLAVMDITGVEETVAFCREAGAQAKSFRLDVTGPEQIRRTVPQVAVEWDRLDI